MSDENNITCHYLTQRCYLLPEEDDRKIYDVSGTCPELFNLRWLQFIISNYLFGCRKCLRKTMRLVINHNTSTDEITLLSIQCKYYKCEHSEFVTDPEILRSDFKLVRHLVEINSLVCTQCKWSLSNNLNFFTDDGTMELACFNINCSERIWTFPQRTNSS